MQRVTSETLFKWTVALFVIPTVLLLLAAYFLVLLFFGGGWAYGVAGAGCHFVLNPLGMIMATGIVLGIFALLFAAGRRVARNGERC